MIIDQPETSRVLVGWQGATDQYVAVGLACNADKV